MRAAGAGRAPGGSCGGGGIGGGGGGRGGGGGGGGGRERSAPLLDRDEFRVVSSFWPEYFPEEGADGAPENDPRLYAAGAFRDFFLGESNDGDGQPQRGPALLNGCDLETCSSVRLDFHLFREAVPMADFAEQLQERPRKVIACVGLGLCLARHHLFPEGSAASARRRCKVTARFDGAVPVWGISDLKSNAVGKFVTVVGNVVRVSGISAMALKAGFACPKCGCEQTRQFVDGKYNPPTSCTGANCKARSFELLRDTATTVDFQKIKLQEIEDDSAEAGRIPRTVEVELHEDLVDTCIPGDVVTLSGVVKSVNAELASGRTNKRAKASGLYLIYLEANSLVNARQENGAPSNDDGDGTSATEGKAGTNRSSGSSKNAPHFTPEELQAILEVAQDDDPFGLVVSSLCPSIFGHEIVKAGLILGLFGGTSRNSEVATRCDPHVLVVGDPGLGKSQMLHAASQASPRSVYVCGNTTSTTGLTVTLSKEGSSGEVGLEAGALVLSDQGTCCIDEFDKMGCDPHALLEAMEQQRISIAKAGVVASLSARCSVLAAANPIGGHYNRGKTIAENLKMSAALLSRFDLVFILLDRPDEGHDKRLSEHIMRTHALAAGPHPPQVHSHSTPPARQDTLPLCSLCFPFSQRAAGRPHGGGDSGGGGGGDGGGGGSDYGDEGRTLSQRLKRSATVYADDPIPTKLLKRYVAYAKAHCHPTLTLEAARVLQKLYLTMRDEARDGRSMPITMRQLESLVRLSQARAKVELREHVTERDAKDVVDMMQESLLEACVTDTGAIDFGRSGATGLTKQVRVFVAALTKRASQKGSALFPRQELLQIANDLCLAIQDFEGFLDVLRQECYLLKKGPRLFQLQTSDFSQAASSSQYSQR
eukprot:jgi/Undpi1/12009/HiC_scaffold_4.g01708.m1